MPDEGSITHWIHRLKEGDSVAARKLWEGYYRRLAALASKKLRGTRRRAADEEDAALSAFASFCLGAAEGRFPDLCDRDQLWRLLLVITARKAADQTAREGRAKRGGGHPPTPPSTSVSQNSVNRRSFLRPHVASTSRPSRWIQTLPTT